MASNEKPEDRTKRNPDDVARERALRDLARLESESEVLGTSAMRRAAEAEIGQAGETEDWAEVWGKRIGRILSIIGVIVLAIYLFATYVL